MKLSNVIFYVSDIEKAKTFYQHIGFTIAEDQDTFISLKTDDPQMFLSLNSNINEFNQAGKQACVFHAENIHKQFQEMQEKKVNIFLALETFNWGKCFIITDPDGNKIEFVER